MGGTTCSGLSTLHIPAQVNQDSLAYSIGVELEKSLYDENPSYFSNIFNAEKFVNKFLIIDKTNRYLLGLNKGIKEGAMTALPKRLIVEIENGTSYNFVNCIKQDSMNYALLFRLYSEEGLNYHEYDLSFDEENIPSISDLYVHLSGELFSESMSKLYFPQALEYVSGSNIDSRTKEIANAYKKLGEVLKLIAVRKIAEGNNLYNSIEEKFRNKKNFLIAELGLVDVERDSAQYMDILNRFHSNYPKDPSRFLLGIDFFLFKGEAKKSLAMVDSLESVTNDDFLNILKGNIYYSIGDYENAYIYYDYMVQNYSSVEDGIAGLLACSSKLGEFDKCIELLNIYVDDFNYTIDDISNYVKDGDDFLEFKQSNEFINWNDN